MVNTAKIIIFIYMFIVELLDSHVNVDALPAFFMMIHAATLGCLYPSAIPTAFANVTFCVVLTRF